MSAYDLARDLRPLVPRWEGACWHYVCPETRGSTLFLEVVTAGAGVRVCPCGYEVAVSPEPGFNIVPKRCPLPKCQLPMEWRGVLVRGFKPPRTEVRAAERGTATPPPWETWEMDFLSFLDWHYTMHHPYPRRMVRYWCLGHGAQGASGKAPSWRYLAQALADHMGLRKRPDPKSLWRLWNQMQRAYEGG